MRIEIRETFFGRRETFVCSAANSATILRDPIGRTDGRTWTDADGDGWTALMGAADSTYKQSPQKADCVRLLLESDADPLLKNKNNETAENLAKRRGHDDVAGVRERRRRGSGVR